MALSARSRKYYPNFDLPLSYRINDEKERFLSVSNVFSNQGRLETRHGISRYNQAPIGDGNTEITSISFFKDVDDTIVIFAKVGTVLYSVAASGSHTALKTGLTATTKHRGITLNNRHIISIESDGLYQYDSTNGFTQLGQAVPSAPTTALEAAGALSEAAWLVVLTFYSSTTGFETNAGTAGTSRTTAAPNLRVALTDIPATAANATIDKVRVYASKDGGSYFFAAELDLGTTEYDLDADPTSSETPPTTHAAPLSGGGKFLTEFNKKLVYSGNNTYKNDIFFSEQDLPDAFDDTSAQLVLYASGNGAVSAVVTGFYNDSNLDPYLVIFKRNKTLIYSEIGDNARLATLSDTVGCLNDKTTVIRNGDVFFMSERGWHAIINGQLVKDSKGNVLTLGNGDIDDIFTVGTGYEYEININQTSRFHSVYYPRLDQYITWVAESSSTATTKAYVYEFATSRGFKVYNFPMSIISSTIAEDSNNNSIVLLGDSAGYIYKHSIKESKTDINSSNAQVTLNAFAILAFFDGNDMATSYNFRDIFLQQIGEDDDITVKGYINFDLGDFTSKTFAFETPGDDGFTLDVSQLDVDAFGDSRAANIQYADINKAGKTFAIGFFLDKLDGRMSLIKCQIDFNKNGNRN